MPFPLIPVAAIALQAGVGIGVSLIVDRVKKSKEPASQQASGVMFWRNGIQMREAAIIGAIGAVALGIAVQTKAAS